MPLRDLVNRERDAKVPDVSDESAALSSVDRDAHTHPIKRSQEAVEEPKATLFECRFEDGGVRGQVR
jgi:hypothetical protein